jgi:hypothetical protein
MSQFMTPAVFHQQVPANEIRQTHAGFQVIMPRDRATRSELGACEEIADLLKGRSVLQSNAHQAGYYVVKTDEFGGAVRAFDTQKDFCRLLVVMDTEIERALPGNPDLLRDVVTTVREGASVDHAASTNSSILKLSGCSLFAPLFDGSRWGHQYYYVTTLQASRFSTVNSQYSRAATVPATVELTLLQCGLLATLAIKKLTFIS